MIIYTIIILIVTLVLFLNFAPTFGGSSKGDSKVRIENSPNFKDGKFQNLEPTKLFTNETRKAHNKSSVGRILFGDKSNKVPQEQIPTVKFNKTMFENANDSFSWFGHSSILIKTSNLTIITDPVFFRASPLQFAGPKAFPMKYPPSIEDLPKKIDVVLVTHDHYDHLDYKTIKKIHPQVEKFIVPLGIRAHLLKWGVPDEKIEEIDWYENISYKNVSFTFAPSRHFSGRGLNNRYSTLWGGWIIKSKSKNMYLSGDGGYSEEFKRIGQKYGPFDIAFIENGAYNSAWSKSHMFPEQSVRAAIDVGAKIVMPIHWGKYDLSNHHWLEPIERFTSEAEIKNLRVATPLIGQIFNLDERIPNDKWWK